MKTYIPLLFVATMFSGTGVMDGAEKHPRSDLLMEPTELAKSQVAKQFVVLDVRTQDEYVQGHVPGAHRVNHDDWKKAFGDGKDAGGWGNRIGDLGISPTTKVVVYDDKGMKDAARIWWILRYWGVEDVRLLNGGWKGWKSSGMPTTDNPTAPASPVKFKAIPHFQRLTTMAQILDLMQGDPLQIVDARSDDEFCGVDKKGAKRGGAIPGAKHLEWSDLIDQQTQRFKTAEQLRQLFDQAGIDLNRSTASHCNGGGRASVMAFGLELMGAKDVRNYYRGWGEWGNAENAPVTVPQETEKK